MCSASEHDDNPSADLMCEALSIVEGAKSRGLEVRLFGGLAIQYLCAEWLEQHPELARATHDIDLVTRKVDTSGVREFLAERGYEEAADVRVFSEGRRMTFYRREMLIDVVVDVLEYCHRIQVSASFDRTFPTLDPALLLVSKAQRVEPRRADLLDMLALLCSTVAFDIDWDFLGQFLGKSWPLWYTVGRSHKKLASFIEADVQCSCFEGLDALSRCLAECPRSFRWRFRGFFGPLLRWHDTVDPVTIEQRDNGKGGQTR